MFAFATKKKLFVGKTLVAPVSLSLPQQTNNKNIYNDDLAQSSIVNFIC